MTDVREPDDAGVVDAQAAEAPPGDGRPRARLLPMWILLAAVVIVGVAWAVSERYIGDTEGEPSVPLVTADETPIKIRPEEPGGVEVLNRDKYVYKSLTDEQPEVEQLLPPPEEPMQRPTVEILQSDAPTKTPAEAPAETMAASLEDTPDPPRPGELEVAEMEATQPGAASETVPESVPKTVIVEAEAVAETGETVAAVEAPNAVAVIPEIEKVVRPAPQPEPPAPSQDAASRADSLGFQVQIGATRDEAAALGELARLGKKLPNILGRLSGAVVRADLGAKGVWYRMRVGPFASHEEAAGVCGQLKAVDIGCFVVAN